MAAPGPSLTAAVAERIRGLPVIAVNDAHRLVPFAEMLYAADCTWWDYHGPQLAFSGECWSSHGNAQHNDKRRQAEAFGLNIVKGQDGEGFSTDPAVIHYGDNSGFQAVNIAGHGLGWRGRIVLVGFDMRPVAGRRHFFGEHPSALKSTSDRGYVNFARKFEAALARLPAGIEIVNCTPGSALRCFRMMDLHDALPVAA